MGLAAYHGSSFCRSSQGGMEYKLLELRPTSARLDLDLTLVPAQTQLADPCREAALVTALGMFDPFEL
jgi:hypothetical protein